jgi:hypothetical protein
VVKFLPLVLFIALLLFAGILAITQEQPETDTGTSDSALLDSLTDDLANIFQDNGEESLSDWIAPHPPRWFKSNAGGMALEEIPSRLAALRNKYALVIDYVLPGELDPRLLQFYQSSNIIEVRVLFEQGAESRKQWLLRDASGNIRLNAVFRQQPDELEIDTENEEMTVSNEDDDTYDDIFDASAPKKESPGIVASNEQAESAGFIEIFNEQGRIVRDYWLYKDGGETLTEYFYNETMLVKAETQTKAASDDNREYSKIYTDNYRYNRSFSLRRVERLYHGPSEAEPVYLLFPSRVLDVVSDADFMKENLTPDSDFLGSIFVDDGYRIIYDTDSRGRILTQTMLNEDDEVLWVIKNTWSGDRIVSILRSEGSASKEGVDERLTEYEYDNEGKRKVQRDIRNGVLERMVYTYGENETEELFMNGVVVLRAYWENGRKIHEERVRH